jgi:hypothetical protein
MWDFITVRVFKTDTLGVLIGNEELRTSFSLCFFPCKAAFILGDCSYERVVARDVSRFSGGQYVLEACSWMISGVKWPVDEGLCSKPMTLKCLIISMQRLISEQRHRCHNTRPEPKEKCISIASSEMLTYITKP